MFKKRPNIPPRPKPPISEQVLDDLERAPEDDIVFVLMKNTSGKCQIRMFQILVHPDLICCLR
jgi:hypothetical protein